jgi:hypothetical protein
MLVAVSAGLLNNLPTPRNHGPSIPTHEQIAKFIKDQPDQSGPIFVWGTDPATYILSGREVSSRFTYLLPLMTPGYGEAAADELLAAWQVEPPVIIVDASAGAYGRGTNAPLVVDHPTRTEDGRTLSSNMEALRAFVRANYHLAMTVDEQFIYLLNGKAP